MVGNVVGNVDDLRKHVFLNYMRDAALKSIVFCDEDEQGYILALEKEPTGEVGDIIVIDNDGYVKETVTSEKIVFGDYESAQLFADENEEKLKKYYFEMDD